MKRLTSKLAQYKQWILSVATHRFLYTNGLYKIYGIMGNKYLYGIVVYSPNLSVYHKWQFVKTYKYHLETDTKPQWYLVNSV